MQGDSAIFPRAERSASQVPVRNTLARPNTPDAMTPSDRPPDVPEPFSEARKLCEVTASLNPW